MHVIVQDERLKASRQGLQYHIGGEIVIEGKTQPLQALNVPNHLNHMRADWSTFCKLATKQGF